MSNFLNFIEQDIEAKKTLLETMPTKTKTNIKKYNEKIDLILEKYNEYKESVKKYLVIKSKSFNLKSNKKDLESLESKLLSLKKASFILNPTNTYLEKLGFDDLIYQISKYYDFNFNSLNEITNEFLNKFEEAGIKLSAHDFDYTCYVYEYMSTFLEVRNKHESYDKVSDTFERVYWVNPEIISHIELSFRKLIKKNEKKFNLYINTLQKESLKNNNITNYQDCLDKIKETYIELETAKKEDITDIISLAKTNKIDINTYFENNKVRVTTYNSFIIDNSILENKLELEKFYINLEKLKSNVNEYNSYNIFMPLISDFKDQYSKFSLNIDKGSAKVDIYKDLKAITSEINSKEAALEKINSKIFNDNTNLFNKFKHTDIKELKMDSVKLAKELYTLYRSYDKEYFNTKVLSVLSGTMTISDFLHIYYSFGYFKKIALKKVFNLTSYKDVIKYSEDFDLFATNPTNIITTGTSLFENVNIARVIMNRYRLDNINITEDILDPSSLETLLSKIDLLLRINVIENSETTVEKIWFMTQVEKMLAKEAKKE